MKNWRLAVDNFLQGWKDKDEVIAVLACGSYVTGKPTKHSDIDLHLILSKEVSWKERGNQVVDGFLIEYFANPAKEIESYFKEDYGDHNYSSPTMFLTGEIIWDKEGIIEELVTLARSYRDKKFPVVEPSALEMMKYNLWDHLDNLQNSYQEDKPDFYHVYYVELNNIYDVYTKYLRYPLSETSKIYETLTDEDIRKKYLLQYFPDEEFARLFSKAINLDDKERMMKKFESLTQYTLEKMGKFNIDGWKMRTPTENNRA